MSASCSRRKCQNDPDSFCYIFELYIITKQRVPVSDFIKKAYLAYFEVKLGDQNKKMGSPQSYWCMCGNFTQMVKSIGGHKSVNR